MINTYFSTKSTNVYAVAAVQMANEIISLYNSSSLQNKKESVKQTKQFFTKLISYVAGNKTVSFEEIKKLFLARFSDGARAKWNEFDLAYNRVNAYIKTGEIEEFGIDHNAKFIDWILRELRIVEANSIFSDSNRRYLNTPQTFFDRNDESVFKQQKNPYGMMFVRNAYRAEKYARENDGFYDMYTPLILERMAIEQYLKALCDKYKIYDEVDGKKTNHIPSIASKCKTLLEANKIISRSLSNEISAVLHRGNVNTHEGYASYAFAVIHGLDFLKYCSRYFKK